MSDGSEWRATWRARWARLQTLDGDEWDAEDERLTEFWKEEYRETFTSFAVSRGWDRDNAEVWCD
jgi:hypothetical protein